VNILTINKLVFDGTEQDFYSFKIKVACPVCNNDLSFLADDMVPMVDLNTKFLSMSFTKQLKLKRRPNGHIYENEKGLESYTKEYKCKNCETKCIIFAGIGETQPNRFNVIVDGILAAKKGTDLFN